MSDVWVDLRANKWMVVDDSTLRFAVRPTDGAQLMLVLQRDSDPLAAVYALTQDELAFLLVQLQHAHQLIERHVTAQLESMSARAADELINRVKDGPR